MADPPPSPFTIQREDSRMSFSSYQPSIARRDSISSNASFYSDVEMAQEEVGGAQLIMGIIHLLIVRLGLRRSNL